MVNNFCSAVRLSDATRKAIKDWYAPASKVDVTAKDTFTGEPFRTVQLGFGHRKELQLPDASERDYYKIQSMKEHRVILISGCSLF